MQKPNDRDLTGSDVIFACNFQSLAAKKVYMIQQNLTSSFKLSYTWLQLQKSLRHVSEVVHWKSLRIGNKKVCMLTFIKVTSAKSLLLSLKDNHFNKKKHPSWAITTH